MRDLTWPGALVLGTALMMGQALSLAQLPADKQTSAGAVEENAAPSPQPDPAAMVLAKVGTSVITVQDLLGFLGQNPQMYSQAGSQEGRAALLNQLIEIRLLRLAAEERMAAAGVPDQEQGEDPDSAAAAREEELKRTLRILVASEFAADAVSEEDLRTAYQARKDQLGIPEAVHIQEIFFPVPDGADAETKARIHAAAEEVLARVKAGESLATLAREMGHTPELRLLAGDQGYLPLAEYPYLKKYTAGMEVGAISAVISLAGGYQIFQLLGRQPAIPPPYDDVKDHLRLQLQAESVARKQERFFREYSQKFGVSIEVPGLASAWPTTALHKAESKD